jgi:hypothetical protein
MVVVSGLSYVAGLRGTYLLIGVLVFVLPAHYAVATALRYVIPLRLSLVPSPWGHSSIHGDSKKGVDEG